MELTTRLTLAEAIAAGGRLLAGAAGPTGAPAPRAVPDLPPRVDVDEEDGIEVDGKVDVDLAPSPSTGDDWRTAAEVALLFRCAPWTLTEHLQNGSLHGHAESGRWSVRATVAAAFLEGAAPAVQRRLCGCRALHLVKGSRRSVGVPALR